MKPRTIHHVNDTAFIHAVKRDASGKAVKGVLDFFGMYSILKNIPMHRIYIPTASDGWSNWVDPWPLQGFNTTTFSRLHHGSKTFVPFPPDACCQEHAPAWLFLERDNGTPPACSRNTANNAYKRILK